MRIKRLIFIFLACIAVACSKEAEQEKVTGNITVTGQVTKIQVSTFQYGTHLITNDTAGYALTSDKVTLDKYINKRVTITGDLVKGYPVDGGPKYIKVYQVK